MGHNVGVPSSPPAGPAGFGPVFAVAEFRALWSAQLLSLAGDQLARVALAVLVFRRTGSAALTGLAVALTFLPHLIGGPLLSGLADRLPRSTVMIGCDLIRAVLIGLLAVPGLPVPALLALVGLAELAAPPFSAARAALLPEIFADEELYVTASAVGNATFEIAQIVGFAVGGLLVAVLGTHGAIAVDAATFALSALVVALGVRRRRPAHLDAAQQGWWPQLRDGARLVFGDGWLRRLVLLAWLAGLFVVPEALAVPIAAGRHAGPVTVGLLLAANPFGAAIGALVLARRVAPPARTRLIGPLAVATGVPLAACLLHPSLLVVGLLWAASGVFASYNLPANTSFAIAVPAQRRGQAFGLAQSGLVAVQGIGLGLAGLVADEVAPLTVVGGAGVVGVVAALVVVFASSHAAGPQPGSPDRVV